MDGEPKIKPKIAPKALDNLDTYVSLFNYIYKPLWS